MMKTSKSIKRKKRRVWATVIIAALLFPVATALCILFQFGWHIYISAYLFLFFVAMMIIEHIAPPPLPSEVLPYACTELPLQETLSRNLEATGFQKIQDIPFGDAKMTLLYRNKGNGHMECFGIVTVAEAPENAREVEYNAVLEAFRANGISATAICLTSIMVTSRLTPMFAMRVSEGAVVKQCFKQFCVGLLEGESLMYLAYNFGPKKWFIGKQRKQLLTLLGFGEKTRGELVELVEKKA